MKSLINLLKSSIGRKFLMAITGLVLTGFVFGHMVGNLQIFLHPDHINGYAHFLQGLGPALWLIRGFLLLCVVVHVWAAIGLWRDAKAARGPEKYGKQKWLVSSNWASRYMRLTGLVVLAFLIYHIAHFTVGATQTTSFKTALAEYTITHDVSEFGVPLARAGQHVHDVYSMVFIGFMNPWVSAFYIIAVTLLTVHILHGVNSLFQTIGWRNHKWACGLRAVVGLMAIVYLLGNIAMPGLILTRIAKPAAGTTAAAYAAAHPCGSCSNSSTAQK